MDLTELFVLYHNPPDFPGRFVVRRMALGIRGDVVKPRPIFVGDRLEQARAQIPQGRTKLAKRPTHDPSVLEVWM